MDGLSYQEFDCLLGFIPSGPTDAHHRQDLAALACLGCRLHSRIADLCAEMWRRGLPCQVKVGLREILAERCRVPSVTPRFR